MELSLRHTHRPFKGSYFAYFLMYNFYYLSWSLFSGLISVYMMGMGFDASQVSLVVSASFLTSMACQPIIGSLSDRYGNRTVNFGLFGLAVLGGIGFLFADNLWSILIGYSFVLMLINGANPIMEKIATTSPYSYGKIRIWGTIGYALGSQIAGLLYDWISPQSIFIAFLLTMTLCLIGLTGTLSDPAADPKVNPDSSLSTSKSGIRSLLNNKTYWLYSLAAVLFFGLINAIHTYMPSLLQEDGIPVSLVSTILSLAVLCEAPLVLLSGTFMDKLTNKTLMLISFGMGFVMLAVLAFHLWMPVKLAVVLLCKHPAGMLFIMLNIKAVTSIVDPAYTVTALAFVQTLRSFSSILFQNLSGQLIDQLGYSSMCLVLMVILAAGLLYTLFLKLPEGTDQNLFS